jgi:poly-gamma-glutamate capsule biosynthesis protein CapA/YwtB (metallophosphatase superfamily)
LFASCDIVLANLECTLPGKEVIATEPRVFTNHVQVAGLAETGINVVSLANNHAFDAGNEGFGKLTALLDGNNIRWFGAGLTLSDAIRPCILEINGIRIAIFGAVDASSGIKRFAGSASSGVPPLDCENLCKKIRDLSGAVDHIFISPHWGHERFRFPSPGQIKQAHAFIDAGASMVLGHHPHVIQGMEIYRKKPIVYSLGNFFVNHVYWDNGDYLTFNRFERTGCILLAEVKKMKLSMCNRSPSLITVKSSLSTKRQKGNAICVPQTAC